MKPLIVGAAVLGLTTALWYLVSVLWGFLVAHPGNGGEQWSFLFCSTWLLGVVGFGIVWLARWTGILKE